MSETPAELTPAPASTQVVHATADEKTGGLVSAVSSPFRMPLGGLIQEGRFGAIGHSTSSDETDD